jgi:large conductance mechanosensitive channel
VRVATHAARVGLRPGRAERMSPAPDSVRLVMGGFKKFLLRGNLIDLAVAVVIGVAFNAVVQSLVKSIITPLIGALGGTPNFSALHFTINNSVFTYGSFIDALLSFVIIAAVVYYLVVMPVNRLNTLTQRNKKATERQCPECLSNIPVAARRCMYCTAPVTPQA